MRLTMKINAAESANNLKKGTCQELLACVCIYVWKYFVLHSVKATADMLIWKKKWKTLKTMNKTEK